MSKVLVKFQKDWADEFDVYGFKIFDSLAEWEATADAGADSEYYFGTNEGWDAGDFSESDFKVQAIGDAEAADIIAVLGRQYGHFPF